MADFMLCEFYVNNQEKEPGLVRGTQNYHHQNPSLLTLAECSSAAEVITATMGVASTSPIVQWGN